MHSLPAHAVAGSIKPGQPGHRPTCSCLRQDKTLFCFFEKLQRDPRIGTSHIALYAALYQCWVKEGGTGPVQAFSHEMMPRAKICSTATYHRALRELDAYGYVRYEPSYSRMRRSKIHLEHIAHPAADL